MARRALIAAIAALLAWGCASPGGTVGSIRPTEAGPAGFILPDIARPELRDGLMRLVTVKANSTLTYPYAGTLVARGTAPGWGNYVAIESEIPYVATSGEEATAVFTVILGNLKSVKVPAGQRSLEANGVYGVAGSAPAGGGRGAELFVAVSSRDYDEYLVIDSHPLCLHLGLYWYEPYVFLTQNTKFMSYPPIDHVKEARGMVEHGRTEPESIAVYSTRCRFTLTLEEYPYPIEEVGYGSYPFVETALYKARGIYEFAQMTDAEGYNLILCWQKGFDGFLREDWEPGTPITLYGHFTTYDAEQDAAVFYARDFTTETMEESLARRPESALPVIE